MRSGQVLSTTEVWGFGLIVVQGETDVQFSGHGPWRKLLSCGKLRVYFALAGNNIYSLGAVLMSKEDFDLPVYTSGTI